MAVPDLDLLHRTTRERLLLAVEAVPEANTVIEEAARLARRMNAEVVVLSVRERAFSRGLVWDVRPAGEIAEVVSHAIYELHRLAVPARGILGRARIGRVADEIVYAALKYQADEIVIGGTDRSALGRLIASSVSPRVLRLSPLPVITIPARPGPTSPTIARRAAGRYQPAA